MGLSSFKRQDPRAAAIADEEDAIAQILPFLHLTPEPFYRGLNLVQFTLQPGADAKPSARYSHVRMVAVPSGTQSAIKMELSC